MQLSEIEDWIEKARKLTVELEQDPVVSFRNDSVDMENNPMKTAFHIVDVEFSYRGNTLTFVLE